MSFWVWLVIWLVVIELVGGGVFMLNEWLYARSRANSRPSNPTSKAEALREPEGD